MDTALTQALSERLGSTVRQRVALAGGDINDAYRVALDDGRQLFVKANRRLPSEAFELEARGLEWLRAAGALRIPEVIAVSDAGASTAFLVLEYLPSSARRSGFDEELGRGLARMHQAHPSQFGFERDNYIGSLPQLNGAAEDWPTFFRERRLQPQVQSARDAGKLSRALSGDFERLFGVLEERVGPQEPPARLHGDLWGGNLHVGPGGEPCLIDPACYGGHREVDLAMMRLFGGFSARVFEAYDEQYPLAPGRDERVPLYQLYPLLVHLNLFGGHYAASVAATLRQVL